jgi:hypothetical protein
MAKMTDDRLLMTSNIVHNQKTPAIKRWSFFLGYGFNETFYYLAKRAK